MTLLSIPMPTDMRLLVIDKQTYPGSRPTEYKYCNIASVMRQGIVQGRNIPYELARLRFVAIATALLTLLLKNLPSCV